MSLEVYIVTPLEKAVVQELARHNIHAFFYLVLEPSDSLPIPRDEYRDSLVFTLAQLINHLEESNTEARSADMSRLRDIEGLTDETLFIWCGSDNMTTIQDRRV